MIHIVQDGDPVLRKIAKEVPISNISGSEIQKILKDMEAALLCQDDGVALAAPQIGVSLRIFIVSKAALNRIKSDGVNSAESEIPEDLEERWNLKNRREIKKRAGILTFINPKIIKLSKDKKNLDEGCLSVRPLYGKIRRSKKATIQAYDEKGNFFERGASGLLAQVFQHETDHLDGILFIDKAVDLKEMPITDNSLLND